VWDDETPSAMFAMLRSVADHERAAVMLREFIAGEVVAPLARALEVDQPELRAALCGSQVVGLAFVRYVLAVEPLASAPADTVVAWVAPTLQRYLTGPP
jgi:hypothetical protein